MKNKTDFFREKIKEGKSFKMAAYLTRNWEKREIKKLSNNFSHQNKILKITIDNLKYDYEYSDLKNIVRGEVAIIKNLLLLNKAIEKSINDIKNLEIGLINLAIDVNKDRSLKKRKRKKRL